MLLVDVLAVWMMARRRGFLSWFGAMFFAGVAAAALGLFLGGAFENAFGILRLWSYGIFLHGSLLVAATAVVWRKKTLVVPVAAAVALTLLSTFVYAFLVEPYWLEATHYRIVTPKIARPVRIVVVADLQTDRIGPFERAALRLAADEKPDLLLFAGDYIQAPWSKQASLCVELRDVLIDLKIAAPLGAFAVRGNVDPRDWREIFAGTNVEAVADTQSFDLGPVRLTCLGLGNSYSTSLAAPQTGDERFHIVLGHVPNFALGDRGSDLLVAGHTHGGQLRLPLLGPLLVNCRLPRRLSSGMNDLPGGGKLFVSRGIGMERGFAPRFRFLCRPELAVIDLVPEGENNANERKE